MLNYFGFGNKKILIERFLVNITRKFIWAWRGAATIENACSPIPKQKTIQIVVLVSDPLRLEIQSLP